MFQLNKKQLATICIAIMIVAVGVLAPENNAQAADCRSLPDFLCHPIATLAGGIAGAAGSILVDITVGPIIKAVFFILAIIVWIGGFLIGIEIWFVQVALDLSQQIVNSTPVKFGFPIVLSIANLMFVLGLIVIAIATILRSQTYGIKQLLWKLIVMAIVVNFGLIFAGAILDISDSLSEFFLAEINPLEGEGNVARNSWNFASSLGAAFQPQTLLFGAGEEGAVAKFAENPTDIEALSNLLSIGNSDFTGQIKMIVGFIFALIAIVGIIILLGALFVMLLYRFVTISILLILLPVAWASWVFPALKSKMWDRWWETFIRWAFFAPIVLFFLWLGIQTGEAIKTSGDTFAVLDFSATLENGLFAAISSALGEILSEFIKSFLRVIILLSIMFGGLVAANKTGVHLAGSTMATMKSVGRRAGAAAWRGTKRAGAPISAKAKDAGKGLQKVGAKGGLLTRIATAGIRGLGRRIEGAGVKGTSGQFQDDYNAASGLTRDELLSRIPALRRGKRVAYMMAAARKKASQEALEAARVGGGATTNELERDFNQFADSKLKDFKDIENSAGASNEMIDLAADVEHGIDGSVKRLEKATDEFASRLAKGEVSSSSMKKFFEGRGVLGLNTETTVAIARNLARAITQKAPHLTGGLLGTMDKNQIDRFERLADREFSESLRGIERMPDGPAQDAALEKHLDDEKRFKNLISHNIFSSSQTDTPPREPREPQPARPQQPEANT